MLSARERRRYSDISVAGSQFLPQNYRCDFAEHEVQAGFEKLEEASRGRTICGATTFTS